MTVIAYDPYASPALAKSLSIPLIPVLKDMLSTSDFVTIHTPLLPSTRGMISAPELAAMKKGARILNVARGGTIDEPALLEALEIGHIGGAGLDVYTSEPPSFKEDDVVTKLIRHPKVVATPHLGASTVEAQENVSRDVCEQVLSILGGALPRSAVNAPLILPEEYKKLQPFVKLVEKMGSLYTQYFSAGSGGNELSFNYDIIYEGSLASLTNTTPLFAALIKGLIAPISDGSTGNVNIVNAELIAKERGIVINESRVRASGDGGSTYSSLVTLRAHSDDGKHTISGYIAAGATPTAESQIYISKLGPFKTSFKPAGHMLFIRNYDSPGKVGRVGTILGAEGVNIASMGVAPHEQNGDTRALAGDTSVNGEGKPAVGDALMILAVDREVDSALSKSLAEVEGVLDIRVVKL
jgi:D-3-phosphoglycerate dehydrogenase